MEKKEQFIASLADLKMDIAGRIPAGIIKEWVGSNRSAESHRALLEPYLLRGYCVCSDTAGLSKMTASKSLVEVMKIVSRPKELVFSAGSALGGKAIGVWAADNTEMFYPENTDIEKLLEALICVNRKLEEEGAVKIGVGVHAGEFYELGKGLFGEDAAMIERVAEDETAGGEIVITESVKKKLPSRWYGRLKARADIEDSGGETVYTLDYGDYPADPGFVFSGSARYPIPFPDEFFNLITDPALDGKTLEKRVREKFLLRKTVIFVKVFPPRRELLLEELTEWVVMNTILLEIMPKYKIALVKSNGDLGIFTADDPEEAVAFSCAVLDELRGSGDSAAIGVASGEILFFDLGGGEYDLAGNAVNIASKISEDAGILNAINVHESAAFDSGNAPAAGAAGMAWQPFSLEKSGVVLRGLRLMA
jgi:class 3 adenylate cyclase